ncbi:unnamed protein product [Durusdinium trenchii]|uniref:Endoplasmic reticulum metallopeptidase 1 n=1 Tax=Durusdinium trenchii TaxID=1381693 RepID=A0ABP0J1A1_9DINO
MAIMTELLRLILRSPFPIDVIFNFNGGEEVLMPAAHGFVTSHPWASSICAQINLEAAGSGGRELLFQAGPSNRWIAEAYKSHVSRPYGSSITQALFHTGLIPGETDFRIYRDFGDIPGADFAVLTNGWVYHTWRDDLGHLDFRSVQRYGETVFEFATGLAKKLKEGRPHGAEVADAAVFFDVGGLFFVEYAAAKAQQLHVAVGSVAVSGLLWFGGWRVLLAAAKLLLCALASTTLALLSGILVASTPAAMVAAGHPELGALLFVPPTVIGFLGCFQFLRVEEVERGSIALASILSLVLSSSPVTVMASYPFFLWSALPALAMALKAVIPLASAPLAVGSYVLPWMLSIQMLVLGVDFLGPLTFRSGTTIPGDLVIAALYGLLGGLMLALSAEFTTHLRHRDVMLASSGIFLFSLLLAFMLFPYSYDRPKRVFQQHVARSEASWNLQTGEVRWQEMEHGLWTIAMDWNNVGTLKTFAPYGLPAESRPHNDSAGIYGQVPMPFPMKAFLMGGSWSPRRAPDLPSRLSLDLRAGEVQRSHYRSLHVSVRGGPQMMMVLAPASRVQQWSFGRYERSADHRDAKHSTDPANLPLGLPRKRSDCDCFFLLYAEGGIEPSEGSSEAFNFTVLVEAGTEMHLDLWALHLESSSDHLRHEERRVPSWVSHFGWVSELQVHHISL